MNLDVEISRVGCIIMPLFHHHQATHPVIIRLMEGFIRSFLVLQVYVSYQKKFCKEKKNGKTATAEISCLIIF